ncbi:SRF-TF-domain-containing protein [Cristinia sonorae]|uniref:SRF-TF-domain-containing protein n=1 Tax=Cristinia sonorae TaxID=1940300 RepID=A0A8K0XT61_9AGAR|nr:SRF-TF-domain-containing protein [Cristinia sonorae]
MPDPASPSLSNKRQRIDPLDHSGAIPGAEDTFITDHDAVESGGDDDDDDEKPKDKKAGRRKIKIEFIQDKSRRHITFSKRKAGIMKKAYELSTLTGTQVLLLVVSETGLVYTFTTAKLQPLVTQPEGKNLIQACLNAPHGTLPSSMPIGTPIGRSANPVNMPGTHAGGPANVPGGLSISGSTKDEAEDGGDDADGADNADRSGAAANNNGGGRKRRRTSSTAAATANSAAANATRNQAPPANTASAMTQNPSSAQQQAPATSPHTRTTMPLPIPPAGAQGAAVAQMSPTQPMPSLDHQQHRGQQPPSPNYAHAPYPGGDMYGQQPGGQPGYGPGPGAPGPPYYATGHDSGAAAAQQPGMPAQHPGWPQPGVQQGNHYGRR